MKGSIWIVFVSLHLFSCSSLTKTQLAAVNQFAQTSSNFSTYPSKILLELAAIREKRGVYFAYSLTDPELHVQRLDSVFASKKHSLQLSKKANITFQIIDKY